MDEEGCLFRALLLADYVLDVLQGEAASQHDDACFAFAGADHDVLFFAAGKFFHVYAGVFAVVVDVHQVFVSFFVYYAPASVFQGVGRGCGFRVKNLNVVQL